MNLPAQSFLVFHTAFIGDIVLMLPMVQVLRKHFPASRITVVTIPAVAELVRQHRAVDDVIPYDKRGAHRGWRGMRAMARRLQGGRFTVALVPHRSLRSALIVRMARIPRRIGFTTSAGSRLFTDRVGYGSGDHEIDRNLVLLRPVIGSVPARTLPVLGVSADDSRAADAFLEQVGRQKAGLVQRPLIALAPGSVWATKRWPAESYSRLAQQLAMCGYGVVLVGGERDREIACSIETAAGNDACLVNAVGKFSLSGSAALLRRCRLLVSNDSAPVHIAMGVGVPVLALFGPTVPAIGFAPVGPHDRVLEAAGLPCRPCNIHGGNECPIGSFACMQGISVGRVFEAVQKSIQDQLRE